MIQKRITRRLVRISTPPTDLRTLPPTPALLILRFRAATWSERAVGRHPSSTFHAASPADSLANAKSAR
jgi:hypothetical protein